MRAGIVAATSCAICVAGACNALLDNEPGHVAGDASPDVAATVEAAADTHAAADAGPDTAADVAADSGVLTPSDFGITLVVWLMGDVGVTTTSCPLGHCVTRWADQSTWKNDAIPPTGGTSPYTSTVAGHGAVSFVDVDGGDKSMSLVIADTPSLQFKNAFSIVAVAADRGKAFPHTGILYSKQSSSGFPFPGPAFFVDCSNAQLMPATGHLCSQLDLDQYVASTELGLFDGVLRAYVTVFDGSSLAIGVNDDAWATQSVTKTQSIASAGVPAHVGGEVGNKQTMTGDLAELVVLDVALTRAQYDGLYATLRAKYALP